jgi:pyrimidine deaminase RibD-like protein
MSATTPQPLLSPAVHVAVVAGAVAIIAVVTSLAGHASTQAVHSAQAALSPAVSYITLQPVEVVVRRGGQPVAQACPNAQPHT